MRNMRRDRRQRPGWTPRRPFRKIAEARRACCAGAWNRHHRPSQWGYEKPVMGVPTQHCSMKECEFWETHFEFKTSLLRLNFKIDFTSLLNSWHFRSILPLHLPTWRICVLWIPTHIDRGTMKLKKQRCEKHPTPPHPPFPTHPSGSIRDLMKFIELQSSFKQFQCSTQELWVWSQPCEFERNAIC